MVPLPFAKSTMAKQAGPYRPRWRGGWLTDRRERSAYIGVALRTKDLCRTLRDFYCTPLMSRTPFFLRGHSLCSYSAIRAKPPTIWPGSPRAPGRACVCRPCYAASTSPRRKHHVANSDGVRRIRGRPQARQQPLRGSLPQCVHIHPAFEAQVIHGGERTRYRGREALDGSSALIPRPGSLSAHWRAPPRQRHLRYAGLYSGCYG